MAKQYAMKAWLGAVLALILSFAIPAAAQANHVGDSDASCKLVGGTPTVTLNVTFVAFVGDEKQVTGTIELDGETAGTTDPSDITWNDGTGTLSFSTQTTPGSHTIQGFFEWPKHNSGQTQKHYVDCPSPPNPGILLTKTGAASAHPGDTVSYSFAVRNTGNVTLALAGIADDKCIDTPVRKAGETDGSFDPGDTFNFSCSYVVPAGVDSVLNTASVCGTYTPPQGSGMNPKDVCDEDQHEFPVTTVQTPPPPPPGTPPGGQPVAPPPAAGGGGVLPEEIVSGRARLRGPSGCVHRAFRARVSGRSIRSVRFYVDGRLVKKFGKRKRYSIKVRPSGMGFGRHRIVARVKFVRASGTRSRTLRLTFRRCAQGTVTPRFTG